MAFPAPEGIPNTDLPLPDPEAYDGEPREYARALMQRKDEIDREIDRLNGVLVSHGSDGSTSLVDPEGYPRGDIDIYSIRHARAALARLATDRRMVNDRLPSALEAAFSPQAGSSNQLPNDDSTEPPNGNSERSPSHPNGEDKAWPGDPLARVNSVAPGSPAAASGLKAGDMIYSFGSVEASGAGLQGVAAVVQSSEGSPINLQILRDGQRKHLTLTPRTGWGGRGSLGCHILPP